MSADVRHGLRTCFVKWNMKLRSLPIILTSSALTIAVAAACSDSGSSGSTNTSDASTASDTGSSSPQTKDGSSGGGNDDGGGSPAKDAGATKMDAGTVVGSCKKINDGAYTVVQTGVSGGDVDASGTYQFLCGNNTSTDNYPNDGGVDTTGCAVSVSQDGCTTTYDCTTDNNGYTAVTKGTQVVNADGNGFTTDFVVKWTKDTSGDLVLDCTFTRVGTHK